MAAAFGDLLQYTFRGTLFGQQCLNVFYYRVVQLTGFTNDGYPVVGDAITDSIIDVVRVIQSADFSWQGYEWRNLSNGIDFGEHTYPSPGLAGNVAGPSMPSYVTWTFRLLRESLATRNGYKRFAGVPEASVVGNTPVLNSGEVNAINAALSADLSSGLALLVEPVIVKRPIPAAPIGSYVYASIGGADFRGIGSQNTRKAGRGN